jgi:outer membrane receptor protein involved in Fe transport
MNWDLIPSVAIHRMVLESSNAAFGLNALGGSLSVELKNGFTWQGAELEALGGSHGRIAGSLQYGKQIENFATYVAVSALHEKGWRQFSPSTLKQLYGDVGWRGSSGELHFNIIAADNDLTGNGTSPVELLAVDRSAVFTHPDNTLNQYLRLALSGNFEINDAWSVQGNAYYGKLKQRTKNGDASEAEECGSDPTLLCLEGDDPPLRARGGGQIPNFLLNSPYLQFPEFAVRFPNGGPYAQLNRTSTDTHGFGGTLQTTHRGDVLGRPNRLVIGGSIDGGVTRFGATSEIGALTLDRGFEGSGIIIDQTIDGGPIRPVDVRATNVYYGLYASNLLDITDQLSLTLAGRLNVATIKLRDQIGTALNGDHSFLRFNPAAGLTYKFFPNLTGYLGYSEANRAPTPAELSCADETAPCSLANFFVADPPLEQVVARTAEAGLRGRLEPFAGVTANWHLGVFRTETEDDIQFVSSGITGRGFFQNVGATLRQGVEAGLHLRNAVWSAFVEYAYIDATFQSTFAVTNEANPFAGPDGLMIVTPGRHLPSIPAHSLKFGANYAMTPAWKVGFTGRAYSGRYFWGDEANLNPKTAPFVVFNFNTSYDITPNLQFFGIVENLFNTKYETFGAFSEVDAVPLLQVPNASDPRSLSPGGPLAAYAGLRLKLNP